jgi:hypothetical protein
MLEILIVMETCNPLSDAPSLPPQNKTEIFE